MPPPPDSQPKGGGVIVQSGELVGGGSVINRATQSSYYGFNDFWNPLEYQSKKVNTKYSDETKFSTGYRLPC